jgi:hypothetical protein
MSARRRPLWSSEPEDDLSEDDDRDDHDDEDEESEDTNGEADDA